MLIARFLLPVYAGVVTAVLLYVVAPPLEAKRRIARFDEIDVGRINVREPDGTLRMTLSNAAQSPGLIVKGREYPHPTRKSAGLIFFNDEGTENGGLIFDGREIDGRATSGGSLTFDRYQQDQVVQVLGEEDGDRRKAGLIVNDRVEGRFDYAGAVRLAQGPASARTPEALAAANIGGFPRAFVGRDVDQASKVVLRDGAGRERLVLKVEASGDASVEFLDAEGKVVRRVVP